MLLPPLTLCACARQPTCSRWPQGYECLRTPPLPRPLCPAGILRNCPDPALGATRCPSLHCGSVRPGLAPWFRAHSGPGDPSGAARRGRNISEQPGHRHADGCGVVGPCHGPAHAACALIGSSWSLVHCGRDRCSGWPTRTVRASHHCRRVDTIEVPLSVRNGHVELFPPGWKAPCATHVAPA